MKCAICGGELVEGALCSTYAIWFYPLGADGKPGYDGRFRLRRTEEGFWSDFFTVARPAHNTARHAKWYLPRWSGQMKVNKANGTAQWAVPLF